MRSDTRSETVVGRSWGPGWGIVARKELADHLLSVRFVALVAVLGLAAAGAVFAAAGGELRDVAPQAAAAGVPAIFLRIFTIAEDPVPYPMATFIGFLGPLLGIMFGFDAVNGERSERTLPRLLSQPIHRDDVITGKFVGALAVVAITLVTLTAFVAGIGAFRLGLLPTVEEVARLAVWVMVMVVYVGFWLALATLMSVVVRRAATSALITISIWLGLSLFGALLFRFLASVFGPGGSSLAEQLAQARFEQFLTRLSPLTLFSEASRVLLDPTVATVGIPTLEQIPQLDRAIVPNLTLLDSLLVVWPQVVTLVAFTVVCFAVAYVAFMRQEVRA